MSTTRKIPTEKVERNVTLPSISEGQVFVHNKSRGTFHVPLLDPKPQSGENPIAFDLGEVKKLNAELLKEQRFINCFDSGYLEKFTNEQYANHLKEEARKRTSESKKQTVGNSKSGLPNNTIMALQQIALIDDIGLLEALQEKEDRKVIEAALEERIDELNSGNIIDVNTKVQGYYDD